MSRGVADGWYSLVAGLRAPRRAPRLPVLRGVALFLESSRCELVGVTREEPGSATLVLLRALFGRRRKLVVFQFIVHPRRHPLRRVLVAVDRWAVRRALWRGQVLTRFEAADLAAHYGLPADRFAYVPWPLGRPDALPPLAAPSHPPVVLCAGRAYCDWPTVFAAARGSTWTLEVVCGAAERAEVERLHAAAGSPGRVRSELPREEFLALLSGATVSLVCMVERGVSSGHIRVSDGYSRGAVVVASATRSLEGYVRDGVDGVLVPPGDPGALRAAVDGLLADPARVAALRAAARERASSWREHEFFAALGDVVAGRAPVLPEAAP